jgi:hypothetical protein
MINPLSVRWQCIVNWVIYQDDIATKILVNEHIIDGFVHASVSDPNRSDRYFMTCNNLGRVDQDHYIIENVQTNF